MYLKLTDCPVAGHESSLLANNLLLPIHTQHCYSGITSPQYMSNTPHYFRRPTIKLSKLSDHSFFTATYKNSCLIHSLQDEIHLKPSSATILKPDK